VSHRSIGAAALAAAVLAAVLAPVLAPAAAPAADDCASGLPACLQVRYVTASDGTPQKVRATASLRRRVERCASVPARRVSIRIDGAQVASSREDASCHGGVARWRAVFSPTQTRDWGVGGRARIESRWEGSAAVAVVTIAPAAAAPQKGRVVR
jgi:hypothetical protein